MASDPRDPQKREQDRGDKAGPSAVEPSRPVGDVARSEIKGFGIVVGIFVGLLLIALGASWGALEIVNATRAYATGEGRYSKAQKIAVIQLHRYAHSGRPEDYAAFLKATAVPRGDRTARLAMESSPPDYEIAVQALLEGENHIDDIPGLIFLFRYLRWWGPFAAAVEDWREGDRLVAQLLEAGSRLNEAITTRRLDDAMRAELLGAIDRLDNRLTELENTFSSHMGEAARAATELVLVGLGATIVVLWAIGVAFASRLIRRQIALDRQLGSSEQRFRDFADVASDWYWETDDEHRVAYLSERFLAAGGAKAQSALGQPAMAFIRERSDSHENQAVIAALRQRQPFRGLRLRYTRRDGSAGYWSLSGKPHLAPDGAFLGYRGVGTDITATVSDQRVLREAKTRAEEANRAKSEFLANMSHELRTPLNAILGFSEVINAQAFGREAIDRYSAYADDIHKSGRHLLSIIDDILDLSKIEAGYAELAEAETTLDSVVHATRKLFGDRFERADLKLTVAIPSPPVRVRVDERKLTQALVNLLSNALKFTPPGGSITLAGALQTDGGLALTVSDTGIGIAPGKIEVALAPFGQIESSFSRQHHGTGLGLSLARSLMELHGGTLLLDSTPGSGTTVTLLLPASRVLRAGASTAALD